MTHDQTFEVLHGDCLAAMQSMPDESVDAVVCDPPYGISYFSRGWDKALPAAACWSEALRVAKPGAHILAFGASRMFHRLAVAIEDAGWEVRDTCTWIYAGSFPKSLDIAKALDASDRIGFSRDRALKFTAFMREVGMTAKELNAATNSFMGSHFLTDKEQPQVATEDMFAVLRPMIQARGFDIPDEIEEFVRARTTESENLKRRKVTGTRLMADFKNSRPVAAAAQGLDKIDRREVELTEAHTEEAKKWVGWGTQLRPSQEFIVVGRKPFKGTVGSCVSKNGTGAMNIGACRIPGDEEGTTRWPANVILDGSPEATSGFPFDQGGSASRYFFCTKPTEAERHAGARDVGLENVHSTLKPVELMRWLVKLVTQPGGLMLDPFCGSGTTGVACRMDGFRFIGCELEAEQVAIARARIAAIDMQPDLFHFPMEAAAE